MHKHHKQMPLHQMQLLRSILLSTLLSKHILLSKHKTQQIKPSRTPANAVNKTNIVTSHRTAYRTCSSPR